VLLSFFLHFSSFHSLHSSPLTGDRKRKRQENDEEKKYDSVTPLFFSRTTNAALSTIAKEKEKAIAVKIAFDGLLFLHLTHSRRSQTICLYSHILFLRLNF
jgi:hypothetical protein